VESNPLRTLRRRRCELFLQDSERFSSLVNRQMQMRFVALRYSPQAQGRPVNLYNPRELQDLFLQIFLCCHDNAPDRWLRLTSGLNH